MPNRRSFSERQGRINVQSASRIASIWTVVFSAVSLILRDSSISSGAGRIRVPLGHHIRFATWRGLKRFMVLCLVIGVLDICIFYKYFSEVIQAHRAPIRIFFFDTEIETIVKCEGAQLRILDNNFEVTGQSRMRSQMHRLGERVVDLHLQPRFDPVALVHPDSPLSRGFQNMWKVPEKSLIAMANWGG